MPEPMETLSGTIGTNSPDRVVPATGIFKASIAPYPSPLSASTRGPQCLKAFGFPIKYFRHNKIKGIFSHPSFLNASL